MLIEVAGIDGAGKSSLIAALRSQLRQKKIRAYEREVRSESRNLLDMLELESGKPFSARDYVLASLLDCIRQGQSELNMYKGSTLAHAFVTGYRRTMAARIVRENLTRDVGLALLVNQIPVPDACILLNVSPETALLRLQHRLKGDAILEAGNPLHALHLRAQAFDEANLAPQGSGAHVISSEMPLEFVVNQVADVLDPLLVVQD